MQTKDINGVESVVENILQAQRKGILVTSADSNQRLPYAEVSFDVVHADQVIKHLSDIDVFISEIYRIAKPGATIIIET